MTASSCAGSLDRGEMANLFSFRNVQLLAGFRQKPQSAVWGRKAAAKERPLRARSGPRRPSYGRGLTWAHGRNAARNFAGAIFCSLIEPADDLHRVRVLRGVLIEPFLRADHARVPAMDDVAVLAEGWGERIISDRGSTSPSIPFYYRSTPPRIRTF